MRRRLLFGLIVVAVVALASVVSFADDSYLATPHATVGPHFHQHMVVRNDLKGSEQKPSPPASSKDIPSVDSMSAAKNPLGRTTTGVGSVLMASASPEMLLENRLRSLAHELR